MKFRYKGIGAKVATTYRTENLSDKEKELMANAIDAEVIRLKSLEPKQVTKSEPKIEKPKTDKKWQDKL